MDKTRLRYVHAALLILGGCVLYPCLKVLMQYQTELRIASSIERNGGQVDWRYPEPATAATGSGRASKYFNCIDSIRFRPIQIPGPHHTVPLRILHDLKDLKCLAEIDFTGTRIDNNELACIEEIPTIVTLSLNGTLVGDDGLLKLGALTGLRCIDLSGTRVSDIGVRIMKRFPLVEELYLARTGITDESADMISKMPRLRICDLRSTRISDTALESLSRCVTLDELYIEGTSVTEDGIRRLVSLLPHCDIDPLPRF